MFRMPASRSIRSGVRVWTWERSCVTSRLALRTLDRRRVILEWRLESGIPLTRQDPTYMKSNPQTAHSPDVLTKLVHDLACTRCIRRNKVDSSHPIADTFVLVIKASIVLSRAAKWLREWDQRDIVDGDKMEGMKWPTYRQLVIDIQAFQ